MKKTMKQFSLLLTLLCCMFNATFYSCSDDDKTDNSLYVSQLNAKKGEVEYLLQNSEYGTAPGTYPEFSKTILENSIKELNTLISKLDEGENTSQETVNTWLAKADAAMKDFKDTVLVDVPEDQRNLQQLKNKRTELEILLGTSDYGTTPGTYPEESKGILNTAIVDLNTLIDGVISGTIGELTKEMTDSAIKTANEAIEAFQNTQNLEDKIYNLYVDGNNGGYIDFGYHQEFANFGTNQNAAFSVELWIKIDEYCNAGGEDNSTYLSACSDNPWGGWRVQARFHNGNDGDLIRVSLPLDKTADGQGISLEEPNYGIAKAGYKKWMHYGFVYSENGVPGEDLDERFRMFYNGEKKGGSIRIGQEKRIWTYTYNSFINDRIPMTAFCRMTANGDRLEYFSGSIKYIRIWKTARTSSDFAKSASGDVTVDTNDPNLVCAWDFVVSSADLDPDKTEFKDLTGKYTATIKGAHSWKEVE